MPSVRYFFRQALAFGKKSLFFCPRTRNGRRVFIRQGEKIEYLTIGMGADLLVAHSLVELLSPEIFGVGGQQNAARLNRLRPLARGGHQPSAQMSSLPLFADTDAEIGHLGIDLEQKHNSGDLLALGRIGNRRPKDVTHVLRTRS